MKAIQLRPYQAKAIDAIQEALGRKQKSIVVEMAAGCGKGIILAKTTDTLQTKTRQCSYYYRQTRTKRTSRT